MGQQWKWGQQIGGSGLVQNNFVINNCHRMAEALPGAAQNLGQSTGLGGSYLTGFCRAGGALAGILTAASANISFIGNTLMGAWDTMMNFDCGPNSGTGNWGSVPVIFKDDNVLG